MTRPLRIGMLVGSTTTLGGGVPQAVQSLSRTLAARGNIEIEIFSLAHDPKHGLDFGGLPLHVAPVLGPRGFSYAPSLLDMLLRRDLDCLHVHGIWMYLSLAAQRWHARTGRPYVVSPHGMLDPWAMRHQRLKKRAARLLYEDAHIGQAACLHALCEAERSAIRMLGYAAPIAIVPNGVDPIPLDASDRPGAREKVLLFLGRVTPKKHVLELLEAWSMLKDHRGWRLAVVGPIDAGYADRLGEILQPIPDAQLAGPAYGSGRAAAYRSAHAFVLPSVSEGLPMGALEALSCGLPSLLTPQCNLPEAFAADAAFEIAGDAEALARGLAELFDTPDARLREMGENGRRLIAARFTWPKAAAGIEAIYRRITTSNGNASAA